MHLAKCGAVPSPEVAFGIGKLDVDAIGGNAGRCTDLLAKILAHGLGLVGAKGSDAFDLDIAHRIGAATKGHGNISFKCRHHVGFWLVGMVGKAGRKLLKHCFDIRLFGRWKGCLDFDQRHDVWVVNGNSIKTLEGIWKNWRFAI